MAPGGPPSAPSSPRLTSQAPVRELFRDVKFRIQNRVIQDLDPRLDLSNQVEVRRQIEEIFGKVIDEEGLALTRAERVRMLEQITDEIIGLGPLEPLLRDESITEIMVNGPSQVYIERSGKLELTDVVFQDDEHLHARSSTGSCARSAAASTRRRPMVDARLPDGSRVNAIIPPLSLDGAGAHRSASSPPTPLHGRRPDRSSARMTARSAPSPAGCVRGRAEHPDLRRHRLGQDDAAQRRSRSFIPDDERIVTIEDAAELQLGQEHVVAAGGAAGRTSKARGAVTIRDLVRNALRMRPDRIIVGECRGGEALDMLQAMNTGHDGSLTTVHANTPRDALSPPGDDGR